MALLQTSDMGSALNARIEILEKEIMELNFLFNGVKARASGEEIPPALVPISNRMNTIIGTHWASTSGITQTQKDQFEILKEEFPTALKMLHKIAKDMKWVEEELERQGAPWTPGRIPTYEVK